MKTLRKTFNLFVALFASMLILALFLPFACSKKPPEAKEIEIGAILPLTGDGARYGEAASKAIELALGEINGQRGVNGTEIKVIYEDSQGNPKTGVSAIQKLIARDKVPAVIGDLFSSVTLAIAPIAEQRKVVVLSPTSSAPKITEAGDYVFRNCASDIFEGSIMGEYAFDKLGIKKVAIIYINNDYGVGIRDVFKKVFTAKGGLVTDEEAFEQSATDFRTQLTKIISSTPEAVYMVGYKEQGQLLKQGKEIGITSQFLSTVMFEDPDIIRMAGGAAEGVIYSARTYDSGSEEEPTYYFVSIYRKKYNETPDIFAALSYDATKILSLAIERGGPTSEGIKTALYGIKHYAGVVGDTSFDANGDVVQPAVMKTVRDGRFVKFFASKK